MTTCARCGDHWTGLSICHCAVCHLNFTSIGAFDEHRTGAADTRHCRPRAERQRPVAAAPASRHFAGGVMTVESRTCMSGFCDRAAVAAVHNHRTSVLVRPDHLTEFFVLDWRCLDCMLDEVQQVAQGTP